MIKILKYIFIILTFSIIIILNQNQLVNCENNSAYFEEKVVSIYDLDGNYIFSIAMEVNVGDRYISEDNIEYVIEKVIEQRAEAKKIGKVELLEEITTSIDVLPPLSSGNNKLIGIYHTHNDESYLPGSSNVNGQGEIFDVGLILAKSLESKGVKVIHSANLHLPHDGAAYERSKATAIDLQKNNPDSILDIHRDAIPNKNEYTKYINGNQISQVRLVVGRQNPNRRTNDQFARQLKAFSDKNYPGLIKDIFYGGGTYNQEISPHALLMEFGTHVSSKEEAEASAKLIATSITQLLYGGEGSQSPSGVREQEGKNIWTTILWIIGIVIISILAYLFINERSIEGVINRIKSFFKQEIIDNFNDREDKN